MKKQEEGAGLSCLQAVVGICLQLHIDGGQISCRYQRRQMPPTLMLPQLQVKGQKEKTR